MISKACVVGQYQTKLEALARHRDLELTVVVPPLWRDERGVMPLERAHTNGYALCVEPMALNGHFHLHFYPSLARVVQRVRPDIVHIDEEPYNLATWQALHLARSAGARTVFFTWQNILRRYPPPFGWFESQVLRHARAIAGNHEGASVLRAKGYRGAISEIPQFGLDPIVFAPEREPHPAQAPFQIGYIGRFVPEKGPDLILRAVAQMDGDWCVHFVGSGPLKAQLVSMAVGLGISHRVRFVEWLPSAEMPDYYRQLDLVVLPSLTRPNWKEQFGRVLTEAMACQVAVVGSDSGEIPHVIGDGGMVFPEGDTAALAKLIDRLRCDTTLRATIGRRGRERVLENYTQARIADRTYAVYAEMMSSMTDKSEGNRV